MLRPAPLALAALLLTTAAVPLFAGPAGALGAELVLWQVGAFDTGSPDQRATEYPLGNGFQDAITYQAGGVDLTPEFPGYFFTSNSAQPTLTARVAHVDFTTCARGAATLRFDRGGAENNDLTLDGAALGTTAVAEGQSASFTFDLGALAAGAHRLTITYAGGGPDNGNYIDALQLKVSPCVVGLDIKPGSSTNPINPGSNGKTPVAILSSADFDAVAEVDRATLTFGRTGAEASGDSCNNGEDVNGDGRLDLVCKFKTSLTGFQSGDAEGVLRGATLAGVAFEARDVVTIVP